MSGIDVQELVTVLTAEAKVLVSRSELTASVARDVKAASECQAAADEAVKRADDMVRCARNMLEFLFKSRGRLAGLGESTLRSTGASPVGAGRHECRR